MIRPALQLLTPLAAMIGLFAATGLMTPSSAVAAEPAKCKKGETLVKVKDRTEDDKAIRVVLVEAKSGKPVADFQTAKAFADEVAQYVKGSTVCYKPEGDG